MNSPSKDATRLCESLQRHHRVIVALSGGVDSSVVAAAATKADLEFVVAVTADSPSVPRWQLSLAREIAAEIGIEHHVLNTREGERGDYRRNDNRRCFYCKETLYEAVSKFAEQQGGATIVSGTNRDDLGDFRPGIQAGDKAGVSAPLAELGFGKSQVRKIAHHFGLSNAELPASPCLASRIAYGVEVTPARLMQIEQAEQWLRQQGLIEFRVRMHAGELARIEVPKSQLAFVLELDQAGELTEVFKSFGFRFVTVDLEGFRSGSMNRVLVSIDSHSGGEEQCRAPTGSEEVAS